MLAIRVDSDHTYRLTLPEGSTVREVIRGMGVPFSKVTLTMVNGHKCESTVRVHSDDRVILIPSDVASLWRYFGKMNLGAESVFSF